MYDIPSCLYNPTQFGTLEKITKIGKYIHGYVYIILKVFVDIKK